MFTDKDNHYMQTALSLAGEAAADGEIPVGAVIIQNGEIIGTGKNCNRKERNPLRHAEILAIEEAARKINNERLVGAILYVSKEPCAMCAGAIIHARIERVIIAAEDEKYGACGTVFDIAGNTKFNHVPAIEFGCMREESRTMLQSFFKKLRMK